MTQSRLGQPSCPPFPIITCVPLLLGCVFLVLFSISDQGKEILQVTNQDTTGDILEASQVNAGGIRGDLLLQNAKDGIVSENHILPQELAVILPEECKRFILQDGSSKRASLDMSKGRYVRNTEARKPYDFQGCPTVKARYNCEHAFEDSIGSESMDQMAYGYKWVLTDEHNVTCDVRSVVEHYQGPLGVHATLSDNISNKEQKHRRSETSPASMINVLFSGNSFVRQVYESMICMYSNHVTKLTIQGGGPDISLAGLAKRSQKIFADEYGAPLHFGKPISVNDQCNFGMYPYKVSEMFETKGPKVQHPLPPNVTSVSNCNDDVGMVEFAGRLRVWYSFRIDNYANQSEAYEHFGLDVRHLNAYLYNNRERSNIDAHVQSIMPSNVYNEPRNLESLLPMLKQQQSRDLGKYFGADNPWISSPPDNHPCMPGIPDDEMYIVMFLLLFDLQLPGSQVA